MAHHIDGLNFQLGEIADSIDRATDNLSAIAKSMHPKPEIHGFWATIFSEMHTPDWIQFGVLLAAFLAIVFNAKAVRDNSKGRDTENYLALSDRFNSAWNVFSAALSQATQRWWGANPLQSQPSPNDVRAAYPQFVELMNLFEAVCHMHNDGLLPATTARAMRDYMTGMLPIVVKDRIAGAWIVESRVNAGVYSEIRKFAAKHSVPITI